MKKVVLALFLFGAAYSCFIGGCLSGLGHLGIPSSPHAKPQPQQCQHEKPAPPQPQQCQQTKPAPPQPQPQPCQQCQYEKPTPPQTQPPQGCISPQGIIVSTPLVFNPQLPPYISGFPSQPAPISIPNLPILTPGYPGYNPGFPQQPLLPSIPQFSSNQGHRYPNAPHQPPKKIEYVLSFDWAPRTNGINNLGSSKGVVRIGSQKIADLSADCGNSGVRHTEFTINLENGENSVTFEGAGDNDSYGVTITNVVIRRKDSNQNLLVNGDFASPCLGPGKWQYIRGGIKGWSADVAQVGDCKIYNNNWRSGQCIELDSTGNQCYTQKFTVDKC